MEIKFVGGLFALALIFSACDKDLIHQEEKVVEVKEESSVNAISPKNLEGEYIVYSDGLAAAIIDERLVYITRFKLIDDFENAEYAYCADMNSPCYEGARYKSVSADGYFKNGEDKKIMAALTYMMNEYGRMETTNPYGYRQMIQSIIWRIIHGYEVTSVYNDEAEIITDVINHIYDNIDEITEDYNTSVTMTGENVAITDGIFVNYGPYHVSENVLLTDVVFELTFDVGGNSAKFVDKTGKKTTQVKPGEQFYVQVSNDVSGEFEFTATASATEELWYVDDFRFFIDIRDVDFPSIYQYQPLFQPLTNNDAQTYFYSCSSSFIIAPIEPPIEPEVDTITLTGLNWNNGNGNGNGAGINQFTVNGITLKNNKNYVVPADFDTKVAKIPGKKDETALYTVSERTVTDFNGKYVKVYDIKVAFYEAGVWKGYGGTITVDNPGGNNNKQQVDLERIF